MPEHNAASNPERMYGATKINSAIPMANWIANALAL